jgi:hypothetical protein
MTVSLGMYVIHARTTLLLSVSDVLLIINQRPLIHTFYKRQTPGVSQIALTFILP